MSEEPQRLAKVVAALVPCSRREAELYVAGGWVRVDGTVVEEPQLRITNEKVEVDPKASLEDAAPVTLLMHKPAGMAMEQAQGIFGAATQWSADNSGIRRLRAHGFGLTGLLPLPKPASGLVVFSQDWKIVRKLQEDAALIEQELIADVAGTIAPNGLARLGRGLSYEGRAMPPARVSWQNETRLRFAVKGIAPEWLPWMCEEVGLKLTALKRIRIGRVPMAGLPPGQWCYLPTGARF